MNAPRGVEGGARNYGTRSRDALRQQWRPREELRAERYDEPAETGERYELAYSVSGQIGPAPNAPHAEDDDFVQAGALYRVMQEEARKRLVENISASLAQVSRSDVIERSTHQQPFRRAL